LEPTSATLNSRKKELFLSFVFGMLVIVVAVGYLWVGVWNFGSH
jgi:hypothetical protein